MPQKKTEAEVRSAVEIVKKWLALREEGMTGYEAARVIGLDVSTIQKYRQRYTPELTLTKVIVGRNGETQEVMAIRENTEVDTTGMKIKSISQSPHGGAWVKYEREENQEINLDEVLESIEKLIKEKVKPIKLPKGKSEGKHLKIFTSDKHLGCPGFERKHKSNIYNKEEYERRMQTLLKHVADFKSIYGDFKSVTYFDLGDNLDGYNNTTTRGGHYLPQNMDNRQQFDAFFDVETRFVESLVGMFGRVNYVAQSVDNHAGAFGYTAYKALEIYINQKYPDCKTHVATEFIEHIEIGGQTIVYCHGKDDKNMKFGMPLYPKSQTTVKIREYMDDYKIYDRVKFIKGDLHQFNYCTDKKYDYVNVPSIMGCSDWIYENFCFSPAGAYIEIDDLYFPVWFQ